jgi:hypothetical protein
MPAKAHRSNQRDERSMVSQRKPAQARPRVREIDGVKKGICLVSKYFVIDNVCPQVAARK